MTGPPPRLVGERVALRPEHAEDADVVAQGLVDDPTMGAMLGMDPEQENAEWLRGTFAEDEQAGDERKSHWFAITRSDSDELIGEIGLIEISQPNRRAGISILVLPRFRRAGVAREAIELLVRWAQGDLGLHRVQIHTLPENLPMQRLAEAAGFRRGAVSSITSSMPASRADRR
jgi:ribosomal-protein-alanine N-acetyltransferase